MLVRITKDCYRGRRYKVGQKVNISKELFSKSCMELVEPTKVFEAEQVAPKPAPAPVKPEVIEEEILAELQAPRGRKKVAVLPFDDVI